MHTMCLTWPQNKNSLWKKMVSWDAREHKTCPTNPWSGTLLFRASKHLRRPRFNHSWFYCYFGAMLKHYVHWGNSETDHFWLRVAASVTSVAPDILQRTWDGVDYRLNVWWPSTSLILTVMQRYRVHRTNIENAIVQASKLNRFYNLKIIIMVVLILSQAYQLPRKRGQSTKRQSN